jgi:hypothetical protein
MLAVEGRFEAVKQSEPAATHAARLRRADSPALLDALFLRRPSASLRRACAARSSCARLGDGIAGLATARDSFTTS